MNDYETIQKQRNITVGLFVVTAMVAIVWLIFKFGELPTAINKFRSFQIFVQFPTAPGVQKDTPVRLSGYQIGRVTKVMAPTIRQDKYTGAEYHQALIVLSIDKKHVNIPSNVEIKLMTRGLGSSYIELKIDPAKLPAPPLDPNRPETMVLVEGVLLQGSTGMTSEFFPEESQKKLDDLANSLGALIKNTNDILGNKTNKKNLTKSLTNISTASQRAIGALESFEKFSAAGTVLSEELTKTTVELRLILEEINEGKGSVGRFINDGRLHENMLEATEQLQALLEEIRSLISKNKAVPIKLK